MSYLYSYLLIGALVLVVMLVSKRFIKPSAVKQALDKLDSTAPDRYQLSNRILRVIAPILGSAFVIAVWPYIIYMRIQTMWSKNAGLGNWEDDQEKIFTVRTSDLVALMSVAEIEETERVSDPIGAAPDVAFGFLNPMWEKFKTELISGDEIWTYQATWESYGQTQNRFGYAILREGGVVHQLMARQMRPENN